MRRRVNGRRRMMRPGRIKRRRRRTRFGNEAGRKMRPIIRMIMIRRGRRRRPLRASLFFDLLYLSPSFSISFSIALSLALSLSFSQSWLVLCSFFALSLSLSSLFWASVPLGHGAYDSGPLGLSASGLLGLLLASVSLGPLGFEPLASAPLDSEHLGL